MTTWTRILMGGVSALVMASIAPAFAQEAPQPPPQVVQTGPRADDPQEGPQATNQATQRAGEKVVVFGRSEQQIGEAISASEGIVGYADFETRPLLRPGELVEVIPGMVAAQHSGGGKANQYFLRGFNLDHGTDFAGSIDGVPLNFRAHPHMNGYLDINFVIPEVIEKVQFYKGTSYAQNGDFSAAGAIDFKTWDKMESRYVEADASDDGDYRALTYGSYDVGDGSLMYAGEYEFGDGPFDRPEDLKKYSAMVKYTQDLGNAKFHVSLMGYDNTWFATDQMPQRAVQSGLISRFGTLDDDLGGDTSRYILSSGLDWDKASLLVYGETYTLHLYNDPTFFLNDPVNGDEFVQVADRAALGARGQIKETYDLGGFKVDTRLGSDIHYDSIDRSALQNTVDRVPISTIRDDKGEVTLADVWGDATVHWTDRFRTTLGARVDQIWLDFEAIQAANSGDASDTQFSPKFSAAYTITDHLEAYASYGKAFHSNDPRGAVLNEDPVTGDPVTPSPVFVESEGAEAGFRYEPSQDFNFSASIFQLELDSELIFVGDAGTSEPSDPTKRSGVEVAAFWQPMDWLTFDGSVAFSKSRFRDVPAGQDRIPNAVESVGSAGATFIWGDGWEASLRARYIGEAPLIEDNSVRGPSTFSMNAGISKDFGPFYVGLDVLNLTDSKDNEIQYFYESQLQGEPAPVEDMHFHPLHPRSFRLVLKAKY
ncbi:MAG TPA: TonB-dependent receptor [Hyphomonadaceae bacterium]|nr:TonB-dependent receptor [Hyphomonadaceae bacterium]